MTTRHIGIILNGVTGRMGTHQHLERSIIAIIQQGGIKVGDTTLIPDPILTGRNADKLKTLAEKYGAIAGGKPLRWTTNLDAALADPHNEIFFDASTTLQRAHFVEQAVAARKAIYCEKPTAVSTQQALQLAQLAESANLKNGVVQDKLWLPGLLKAQQLIRENFFGKILCVRGNFGYWVFTGHDPAQPPQRPSWNYRASDGGGIILDMFCHWQYVIENLFAPISSLAAFANTDIPQRIDEAGKPFTATADDSAYAIFQLQDGTICQFNSSWCTRVRRDDLFTIQIDGTRGSCVATLRDCFIQSLSDTPRPVWNPDIPQPIDFYAGWKKLPDTNTQNAFKAQWELFLKHVAFNEAFPWTLRQGAKGVQLAELGMRSWHEKKWLDVSNL